MHIDGLVGALRAQGVGLVMLAPSVAAAPDWRPGALSAWLSRLRRKLPRVLHESLELLYNLPEGFRLLRAIRRHRPDAIYERSNLFMLSGALLAPRLGVKRITEVNAPYFQERSRHGGIRLKRLARWTEEFSWRSADAVIPVTQVLAEIVQASGVPPGRVHVMSNGIDMDLFSGSPRGQDLREQLGWEGRVVLGFTGFVREWNGLEPVMDLLAAPGSEALVLLVVGDGPAREPLEARAERLGVGARVHFTGLVPRIEIPRYVAAFDIALQPAANPYASPLKLFEYMALRRAIVAPDQPNIREVLKHEGNALLFRSDEPGGLADAVLRLARDLALRDRLADCALATVRERDMTWANNGRRVIQLVQHLVGHGVNPALGDRAPDISTH